MVNLLVGVIVVILLYVFRKQIQAMFITGQKFVDARTDTSVKIEQAIRMLAKKKDSLMTTHKSVNVQIGKLKIQCYKEMDTAMQTGGFKVVAIEDCTSPHHANEFIVKGREYVVEKFSKDDMKYYSFKGFKTNFSINIFDIVTESKHLKRQKSLVNLVSKYEKRCGDVVSTVKKIKGQISSLEADKAYVTTIESLIDIEQWDDKFTSEFDSITAEIEAVEKQLEKSKI